MDQGIDTKSTLYPNEKGHVEHVDDSNADVVAAGYKADAMEAESAEHAMTVLEAVKAYPMACFWAFIMSFTIVSFSTHSMTHI